MFRCIKMGLFKLCNSVWLIHCLKSQIAMMTLIDEYFGFNGVSFQITSSNSHNNVSTLFVKMSLFSFGFLSVPF